MGKLFFYHSFKFYTEIKFKNQYLKKWVIAGSVSCQYLIIDEIILCCQLMPDAAAKSLQSCPALCDPIDGSQPGSPVPGILQARVLEWGAIAFSEEGPTPSEIYTSLYPTK